MYQDRHIPCVVSFVEIRTITETHYSLLKVSHIRELGARAWRKRKSGRFRADFERSIFPWKIKDKTQHEDKHDALMERRVFSRKHQSQASIVNTITRRWDSESCAGPDESNRVLNNYQKKKTTWKLYCNGLSSSENKSRAGCAMELAAFKGMTNGHKLDSSNEKKKLECHLTISTHSSAM